LPSWRKPPWSDTHKTTCPSKLIVSAYGGDTWSGLDLGVVQPDLCADIPRLRLRVWRGSA
jgi:hypothetical protein